jgi:hypothetical protein
VYKAEDLSAMSKTAGLTEEEQAHFIAGMHGDTGEAMPLNRKSYAHLQGTLEEFELNARAPADFSSRIAYRRLSTYPAINLTTRAEIARRSFTDGRLPFLPSARRFCRRSASAKFWIPVSDSQLLRLSGM